jgi:hypothetical protein
MRNRELSAYSERSGASRALFDKSSSDAIAREFEKKAAI